MFLNDETNWFWFRDFVNFLHKSDQKIEKKKQEKKTDLSEYNNLKLYSTIFQWFL